MRATAEVGLKSRGHGPLLHGTMRDRVLRARPAPRMADRGHATQNPFPPSPFERFSPCLRHVSGL